MPPSVIVHTSKALMDALAAGAGRIGVAGRLTDLPTIRLSSGQALEGHGADAALVFNPGADGVGLSGGTSVCNLTIRSDPERRAIFVAREEADMGLLALRGLRCRGQVQLLFERSTRFAHMLVEDVWVEHADMAATLPLAEGNGVRALQGAVTLWNRIAGVTLTAALSAIRVGREGRPVRGGGLFIAGGTDRGAGRIFLPMIETLGIHVDSMLPAGTEDRICGGLFILPGAKADRIRSEGALVSHGANAVPVDNWGAVHDWRIGCDVRSHGPNAVAIVNAGRLDLLDIRGDVETFGDGARGLVVYGPTGHVRARSIRTHGRAAAGVDIVDRLDSLDVPGMIEARGEGGMVLVKGAMENAPADAIRVARDGRLGRRQVGATRVWGADALPIRREGRPGPPSP